MNKPILAVTMGDPGGIGPEIIAKSLQSFHTSNRFFYLLIGASDVFEFLKEELRMGLPLNPIPTLERSFLREDSINFLDITKEAKCLLEDRLKKGKIASPNVPSESSKKLKGESLFDIGEVSLMNGAMAMASIKVATYQAVTGLIDAVVTAPIHKSAVRLLDPKFIGHTEYLAKISQVKHYAMMFVSDRLKVTLVTIHVPLKKVSRMITTDLVFEKIDLTQQFLKQSLKLQKPKIAVCALNPHGGEAGAEEEAFIRPAVLKAQKHKINAVGPWSADELFHKAYEGRVDAVVSMYHDQGLGPFKMVAFHEGVNVTLGLPFVRTSPDHGTAFDIAYQGKADPRSMQAALNLAEKLL